MTTIEQAFYRARISKSIRDQEKVIRELAITANSKPLSDICRRARSLILSPDKGTP